MSDVVISDVEMKELAAKVNKVVEAQSPAKTLRAAIEAHSSQRDQFTLDEMGVDTFTAVSNYENNRDVMERAAKQAKKSGTHHTSAIVAIAMLDKEKNKDLWERTEAVAKEQGIAHTLPFIKLDGHTRAYGWTTPSKKDATKTMFERPECLSITVYRNQTDAQIHEIVHNYCDGVNKANNVELQQMGMKKAEFDPQTDFVRKDSWKTAFRTIDSKHGKADLEGVIELFKDQLMAIDALNIDTTNKTKKLSGVRAAMISTYDESNSEKWVAFWSDFFAEETTSNSILRLIVKLGGLKTGAAKEAKEQCEKTFKKYQE